MFPILAGSNPSGYNLTRSLRFRSSASAYLNRTPASAGNRKTWTLSLWMKRSTAGTDVYLYEGYSNDSNRDLFRFANDTLVYGNASATMLQTTQVFRDPSAWYHFVLVSDTTQATAANRVKLYVNGSQITAFTTSSYPAQNYEGFINSNVLQTFMRGSYLGGYGYQDGYLTEVNFIDGQALTPSSFGSTNTLTGVWQPARYAGSYGTNGFYLPFTDNSALTTSSNVGLGKDFSGNANYWVTNNISITSGVTYDSMTDVPTLTSATAANFAVLNRLSTTAGTYSNANLRYVGTASWRRTNSTIAVNSGKWYWEVTLGNAPFSPRASNTAYNAFGFGIATTFDSTTAATLTTDVISLSDNGYYKNFSGAFTDSGVGFASGDVLSIAVDLTANTFTFYRNNSSIVTGTISVTAGTTLTPVVLSYDGTYGVMDANFGQRPFAYTPPTGFVALNAFNLPTSTIVKGNTVMDATLYTGNGSTQTITNAAAFKPDLVWQKSRSNAISNILNDSVRGVSKTIYSNLTNAEANYPGFNVTAFNSNGFSVGDDSAGAYGSNGTGQTYVGWQWQAGQGTTSSNTNGTITSTVSVNASAGFSVVTYTGNGTNPGATIGHGLGVAPSFIVTKSRSGTGEWPSYHASVGVTNTVYLNATYGSGTYLNRFSAVSSSTFTTGSSGSEINTNGVTYVAYCWTPIAGFSAFGSYTGNGSADGPFVYTGFRPKFVLIKGSSFASNWFIQDSARNGYNVNNGVALRPNLSNAEDGTTTYNIDILSNGFKLRSSAGDSNTSGATFVYAAFAENPTKNALAR